MSLRPLISRVWPVLLASAVAAGIGAACSANPGGGQFTGGNGTGGTGAGHASSSSSSGDVGFGAHHSGGAAGNGNTGGMATCAAEPHQAQQLPLDMYIMLDQSGSMTDTVSGGATKWEAVTTALQTFLTQPGLGGISVGIQYFGLPSCPLYCNTDADCGSYGPCDFGYCYNCFGDDSCNASDYATPEVEIAPLPGAASALLSSIAQHSPETLTPTAPALQGAIQHAQSWGAAHPGHISIAVFATDGIPTECSPTDAAGIAQIAAQGNAAGTKSFIIGVFAPIDQPDGPNLLDAIAAAGGTGQAFNISTTQNVGQAFLDALNVIRGAALGCQYDIPVPEAGTPDYGKVNVQYTPGGGGTPTVFDHYLDKAHCPASGDGWYYDDDAHPTQIILCDPTCNKVSSDTSGKIDILLGCQTKLPG